MPTGDAPPKSKHGGSRPGSGRKKKSATSPTAVVGVDLIAALEQPPPESVDAVASQHATTALGSLVKQLKFGESDPAKISAANAILDRGYGKPAVDVGGEAMLPFMAAPTPASTGSDIRSEARRYARLAIEVLRKIADAGGSENARVSASKSLLDRGLGTVAAAKLPDEFGYRPLGKKEEAAQAAQTAATGRFATPPPPTVTRETLQ